MASHSGYLWPVEIEPLAEIGQRGGYEVGTWSRKQLGVREGVVHHT